MEFSLSGTGKGKSCERQNYPRHLDRAGKRLPGGADAGQGRRGCMAVQIHSGNHGQPKHHRRGKHGEHAHDFLYDDSGKCDRRERELTDRERKENSDIL